MGCKDLPLRRPPCPYFGSEVNEAKCALAWCRGKQAISSLAELCKTTGRGVATEADELPHEELHRTLVQSPPATKGAQDEWFHHLLSTTVDSRGVGEARPDRLSEWFLLPSRDRRMKDRPTLVLDLDETLVSSVEGYASVFEMENAHPHKVRVVNQSPASPKGVFRLVWRDGGCLEVRPRPGLGNFLAFVRKHFEVILWTAGTGEYARAVLSVIDPAAETFAGRVVARDKRWFRPQPDGQGYAKDLRRLGRSLQRTVLVDNSPAVCRRSPENSIVVPDWLGEKRGKSDGVLLDLLHVLTRWLASREPVATFLCSCTALLRIHPDVPGLTLDTVLLYHLVGEEDEEVRHKTAKPAVDAAGHALLASPSLRYSKM
eukprot:Hpha_TRINITY_DN16195_c0_g3::TRINITY_DN16195_c0_g3_i1::g.8878::m.8878